MKKKIIIISLILLVISILLIVSYKVINKVKLNGYIDKTIEYKDKINYSTNINLKIRTKESSSEVDYDIVKSYDLEKIVLSNKVDNKLKYRIIKYVETKNNKKTTYVYDGEQYEKDKKSKEIFNVRYEELKGRKVKKISKNKYEIRMKSYDAYNMIYPKDVVKEEATNKDIDVTIVIEEKTNFIKEIYYEIDDMGNNNSMTYIVRIENRDINNHNKINLPF